MHTRVSILAIVLALCAGAAYAQDDQSLGDLARQQRQEREQSKTAKAKDAKPAKVITNSDLPAHSDDPTPEASDSGKPDMPAPSAGEKPSSEGVRAQIQEQKSQIGELQ